MLFTDVFFLAYFLPAFLLLARLTSLGGGGGLFRWFVILATLVFYAFENALWVGIFAAVVLPTYACAWALSRTEGKTGRALWVALAVVISLGVLGVFKYLNWCADLWPALVPFRNWVAQFFGAGGKVELPPGISFYVFEAISFVVDIHRRRFDFPRFRDFANFICLFPRFIAGPIVRYTDVQEQLRAWPGMQLSRGLLLFALGFSLKVTFADQFAKFVPYAFGPQHPDFLQALVGSVAYSCQLYFDFWGYSVMAMGLGACVGFAFPDNFLRPYAAVSITDFWRRWHVSLSSWLRDYLYIPLGGSRCSPARRYFNLLATMALAGLWHGASSVFVLWGCYHGLLLVLEKLVGVENVTARGGRIAMRVWTLLAVLVGWVLFRAESLAQAQDVLAGLCGRHGWNPQFNALFFERHLFSALLAGCGLLFLCFGERLLIRGFGQGLAGRSFTGLETALILGAFLFALLVRFGEDGVPFLYFQF